MTRLLRVLGAAALLLLAPLQLHRRLLVLLGRARARGPGAGPQGPLHWPLTVIR